MYKLSIYVIMNTMKNLHKIFSINNPKNGELSFSYAFKTSAKLCNEQQNKKAKNSVCIVYHEPYDENYAIDEAVKETESEYPKAEFVKIKDGDDGVNNILNLKSISKKFAENTPSEIKTGVLDKGLLKYLIPAIISAVLELLIAAAPTFFFDLFNLQFADNKPLYVSLFGLALLAFLTAIALLTAKIIKKINKSNFEINMKNFSLSMIDTTKLTQKDFRYDNRNTVFLIWQASYNSKNKLTWDIFNKYIELAPPKYKITCIILKLGSNLSELSARQSVEEDFKNETKKYKSLTSFVSGYCLIPLNESQKFQLIDELEIKNIPTMYMMLGRDRIYSFNGNAESYSAEEINGIINKINLMLNDNGITREELSFIVSLLASLARLFVFVNDNLSEKELFDVTLLNDLYKRFRCVNNEDKQKALFDSMTYIWRNCRNELVTISEKEYCLLSRASQDAQSVNTEPIKSAIERFLRLTNLLHLKDKNELYSKAAFELNVLVQKIIQWTKNNKPHLFATHITDNFLDIFKNILKLNALNGFFVENYALLEVIHETYTKTQDNDNKTKFNEFYFSDEVKTAYRQNAVVSPSFATTVNNSGLTKNYDVCVLMHETYLNRFLSVSEQKLKMQTGCPDCLKFFETNSNENNYYSLLIQNGENDVIEFYKALSRILEYSVQSTICAKYFLINDENPSSVLNMPFTIEPLSMALKTILHTEESGEILAAMFDDKTTEQELLTCAILKCDAFYLLHDLYSIQNKNNQITATLSQESNISNTAYKIADIISYIEQFSKHYLGKPFSSLVNVCRSKNVQTDLITKYFLGILRFNILATDKIYVTEYLSECEITGLSLRPDVSITQKSLTDISILCFSVKTHANLPDVAVMLLDGINPPDELKNQYQDFKDYILSEKQYELTNKETELAFIDKIKKYDANICYLIYTQITNKTPEMFKYAYRLSFPLLTSIYMNNISTLIKSLEYLDTVEITKMIRIIDLAIGRLNLLENSLPQSAGILSNYYAFYTKYCNILDKINGEQYCKSQKMAIELKLQQLNSIKAENLREKLSGNYMFIAEYALNMISLLENTAQRCRISDTQSQKSNTPFEYIMTFKPVVKKDSEKYINDAYTESIKSIVEKSESITRDNQQKLNQKITNDILDVLQNELYPLNIDEPTETVTFIDRNEIRAHINLLTRLRLANNQ